MDGDSLLTIIGGILILAFIIVAFIIRIKTKPSAFDKQTATEFLEGLADVFYDKIMGIINGINISDYKSLPELEAYVLNEIYTSIWDYVSEKLEEAAKTDILTALTLKVLNKDFVDKFIERIIENCDVDEKISNLWNSYKIESTSDSIKSEDEELQSKFSDNELYNDSFDTSDLIKSEEVVDDDNDEEELPEEVVYDPENDDSVEIIVDSKGRKRSKATGRYV